MSGHSQPGRPAHLAHHFDSAKVQFETGKLGMWVFLASEILFFGGLFAAYGVFRGNHPDMFHYAQYFLDWKMGATNTVVLITSSFTAAMSVRYAQTNNKKALVGTLSATLLLAGVFMVIKYLEYTHKIQGGVVWGAAFNPTPEIIAALPPAAAGLAMPPNTGIFFAIYFCMTGLHGIHVVIGMGLYAWLIRRAQRGDFNEQYFAPVDTVALYWHLVDLIWIFLFPLLYLIG